MGLAGRGIVLFDIKLLFGGCRGRDVEGPWVLSVFSGVMLM